MQEISLPPLPSTTRGWSGGAMVLGKLSVPGRPTIWISVGQGPTALAVGAGGGCLDIFTLIYPFSPLSPSLWETARYRMKYCLKGPLNQKQPTNQPTLHHQPPHISNLLLTVPRPFFRCGILINMILCPLVYRHLTIWAQLFKASFA